MKNFTKFAISALALTGVASADVDVTAYSGAHTNYIFRGADAFNLGDNTSEGGSLMDFGLDVTGSCDCGLDWFLGTWYGATQQGLQRDEFDIFGGVSKDLGFGVIEAGYITYNFINGDNNGATNPSSNGEIFLGLSTGYAGFDLGLRTFYGVQGGAKNNTTIEGTIGYSVEIYNTVIGLEAKAGMFAGPGAGNNLKGGSSIDGLAYQSITASTDISLADDITFTPYVAYHQAAEELVQGLDGFVGGATFAYNF